MDETAAVTKETLPAAERRKDPLARRADRAALLTRHEFVRARA
jgi:hypothetical protein